MSNHSASYILSDVISLLKKEGFFKDKPQEEVVAFIKELDKIGNRHDHNSGEMLEDHEDLSICYICMEHKPLNSYGLCSNCD